jgi:hypothetical protein
MDDEARCGDGGGSGVGLSHFRFRYLYLVRVHSWVFIGEGRDNDEQGRGKESDVSHAHWITVVGCGNIIYACMYVCEREKRGYSGSFWDANQYMFTYKQHTRLRYANVVQVYIFTALDYIQIFIHTWEETEL